EGKVKGAFHFRSHPAALKALIDSGFNLFSLANNHAFDYGAPGIEETLYHLAVANAERAIAYAGIGSNFEEAIRPGCLDLEGTRIALSAIGIISIHNGLEGRVEPDERQLADWRGFAAEQKNIDLIVGHHPHVALGVELNGKSLIFYGLGNFLPPGTADLTRCGMCRDYGMMAKVHLARIDGAWRVEAIEAIPLTNTQMQPGRFKAGEGTQRIYQLNH